LSEFYKRIVSEDLYEKKVHTLENRRIKSVENCVRIAIARGQASSLPTWRTSERRVVLGAKRSIENSRCQQRNEPRLRVWNFKRAQFRRNERLCLYPPSCGCRDIIGLAAYNHATRRVQDCAFQFRQTNSLLQQISSIVARRKNILSLHAEIII